MLYRTGGAGDEGRKHNIYPVVNERLLKVKNKNKVNLILC